MVAWAGRLESICAFMENLNELKRLYLEGHSLPEIAAVTGISPTTIRRRLLTGGVALRSRSEGIELAKTKGRCGSPSGFKHPPRTPEARERMRQAALHRGERLARGLSYKTNGYVEHTRGEHKSRGQHRTVMEAVLGRPLRLGEEVHHKDGNKQNNTPSNLEVLSKSEHMRKHALANHKNRKRAKNGRFS